jgi:DNA (cytosine-5)-methyltransferase 1
MIKFIDLFSGIGGFRIALENLGCKCVFSSEIDAQARETYKANFGEYPSGDIFKIKAKDIPNHDILCAGFPCQPFSVAGKRLGFEDARGTLFFEVARIIKEKRPKAFLLENVAGIVSQDNGKTLDTILNILNELDYNVSWKLLNAKHYGVPQNRNRWYCVGVDRRKKNINLDNIFPNECDLEYTLKDIINNKRKKDYTVSKIALGNIKKHLDSYLEKNREANSTEEPIIANNIRPSKVSFSSSGVSPCLTAKMGTGGNNVPVIVSLNRKFTTAECLKIMGFPDSFKIKPNYSQSYKQIGNSVVVPIIEKIAKNLIEAIF